MLKPKTEAAPKATSLPGLIRELFEPAPAERFVIVTDTPSAGLPDSPEWEGRRAMAELWRAQLAEFGAEVPPLLKIPAQPGGSDRLEHPGLAEALGKASCAVVFSETHSPAAWRLLLAEFPRLRVALLPGVSRRLEETTWAAGVSESGLRAERTRTLLSHAMGARIHFSTGQEVYFDLRYQHPGMRGSTCRARDGQRLVTLPGGEAWTSTYDGDGPDPNCDTIGIVPFYQNGLLYQFFVERGRIMDIIGDGPQVARYRKWFEEHPDSCRVRRLGFGCNFRAATNRSRGEARTAGFYWSIDLHGEPVQLIDNDPSTGLPPLDYLYAHGQPITAAEVCLVLDDARELVVVENGRVK